MKVSGVKLQEDEKRKKFKKIVPTTSSKRPSAKTTGDDPGNSDVFGEKEAPDTENNPDETIKSTPTASPDERNINVDPNESEVPSIETDPDKNIKSSPTASPDDTNINVDPNESVIPDAETGPNSIATTVVSHLST